MSLKENPKNGISPVEVSAEGLAQASLAKKQREEIVRGLRESKRRVGDAPAVAARMGVNCTTLLTRTKKLGIEPTQYA